MEEIKDRKDIRKLVGIFYGTIRKNEVLGPIFNKAIPEETWEAHMEKITDFWDSAVFGTMTFKGNPATKHVELDKANNYSIDQKHFAIWLTHWKEIIDANYTGAVAENMKLRAEKMATGLYLGMWHHKPDELKPEV
ncbi:MAG: group III truncated hemoglobin [Flavobacteriales bacterium]